MVKTKRGECPSCGCKTISFTRLEAYVVAEDSDGSISAEFDGVVREPKTGTCTECGRTRIPRANQ